MIIKTFFSTLMKVRFTGERAKAIHETMFSTHYIEKRDYTACLYSIEPDQLNTEPKCL